MNRYYVTVEIAVEAETRQDAEMLVVRRMQDNLGTTTIVCEECGHENERTGGNKKAGIYVDASIETAEDFLRDAPAMLVQETGYVAVKGGKPIPGDGSDE